MAEFILAVVTTSSAFFSQSISPIFHSLPWWGWLGIASTIAACCCCCLPVSGSLTHSLIQKRVKQAREAERQQVTRDLEAAFGSTDRERRRADRAECERSQVKAELGREQRKWRVERERAERAERERSQAKAERDREQRKWREESQRAERAELERSRAQAERDQEQHKWREESRRAERAELERDQADRVRQQAEIERDQEQQTLTVHASIMMQRFEQIGIEYDQRLEAAQQEADEERRLRIVVEQRENRFLDALDEGGGVAEALKTYNEATASMVAAISDEERVATQSKIEKQKREKRVLEVELQTIKAQQEIETRLKEEKCREVEELRRDIYETTFKVAMWEWQNERDEWIPYPQAVIEQLENAWAQKQVRVRFDCVDCMDKKHTYDVNLLEQPLVQQNVVSKTTRNLRRVLQASPMSVIKMPAWWKHHAAGPGPLLHPLAATEPMFDFVKSQFENTDGSRSGGVQGRHIVSIQQVQNKQLWHEHSLVEQRTQQSREVWAFHGCSADTTEKIAKGGLDWRFCGLHGTVYGKGSYLADSARYSDSSTYSPPDGQGLKHIFLARCVVGRLVRGQSTMAHAPDGAGGHHVAVDNVDKPTIYVVFDHRQAYPGFLITYK